MSRRNWFILCIARGVMFVCRASILLFDIVFVPCRRCRVCLSGRRGYLCVSFGSRQFLSLAGGVLFVYHVGVMRAEGPLMRRENNARIIPV